MTPRMKAVKSRKSKNKKRRVILNPAPAINLPKVCEEVIRRAVREVKKEKK